MVSLPNHMSRTPERPAPVSVHPELVEGRERNRGPRSWRISFPLVVSLSNHMSGLPLTVVMPANAGIQREASA